MNQDLKQLTAKIKATSSDIANVLILNEGKANCADLVLQQIMEGILQDAELSVENRL